MRNAAEFIKRGIVLPEYQNKLTPVFKQHDDYEIIKPNRFIYHVSRIRNRFSIAIQGLISSTCETMKYKNAIFANNGNYPNYDWYPFCIDGTGMGEFEDFDYWQIDTHKIPNRWYMDPANDIPKGIGVVTFGNIPPQALSLYEFKPERLIIRNSKHSAYVYVKKHFNSIKIK